jgi:hypothetical protein
LHIHGYAWWGEKFAFDKEGDRRPESPGFPYSELPPMQTAHWLTKPSALIRGTWEDPKSAAEWLDDQLRQFAPRFASRAERDTTRLTDLVVSAAERLTWGGDVSLGHYLSGTLFHSVSLVTCTPNGAASEVSCPAR